MPSGYWALPEAQAQLNVQKIEVDDFVEQPKEIDSGWIRNLVGGCAVSVILVFCTVFTFLTLVPSFDFGPLIPSWWPDIARILGFAERFQRVGEASFSCSNGTQIVGVYAGHREKKPVLVIGPIRHLPEDVRLLVLTGLELLNEPDDDSVWALLRAQDEKIPCCVITEKEIFITPDEWLGRVYEIEKTQGESPGWCRKVTRIREDGNMVFRWTVTKSGEKMVLKIPDRLCSVPSPRGGKNRP
ncbi:MAG: hypothetical protein J6331_07290 [Lentisphaeria bacterium]|nr:hypothetical protein [Lentisphaeria bacterium]